MFWDLISLSLIPLILTPIGLYLKTKNQVKSINNRFKMKKFELLELVAELLEENLLELHDEVIDELYTEAKIV